MDVPVGFVAQDGLRGDVPYAAMGLTTQFIKLMEIVSERDNKHRLGSTGLFMCVSTCKVIYYSFQLIYMLIYPAMLTFSQSKKQRLLTICHSDNWLGVALRKCERKAFLHVSFFLSRTCVFTFLPIVL